MEADESDTIARQKSHRSQIIDPKITEHKGRIVNTTGDGLLVEFASVINAVNCAVAIQKEMKDRESDVPEDLRIQYRIGINLGDIVIDSDDILGDGVNIAARLEALALPGGICISENVFSQVKNKLNIGFEELGPTKVKNLKEPIVAFRLLVDPREVDKYAHFKQPVISKYRLVLGSAISLFLLTAGGVAWWQPWNSNLDTSTVNSKQIITQENFATDLKEIPSIAVLPFRNVTENDDRDYFSEGISDDIIVDLTKVPRLLVIARDSSFLFRNENPDILRIAESLKAAYVLQGSVRRSKAEIRINTKLIDGKTGQVLWGQRYDGNLEDVFSLQDQITKKIVTSIALKFGSTSANNLTNRKSYDLALYELFLKARNQFLRFSKTDTFSSRKLFQRIVNLDRNFAEANAYLAWTHAFEFINGWSESPELTQNLALETASKALELDDQLPLPYFVRGLIYRERREIVSALAEAQKAIQID
ncbi:MAG: adenylate/guanylate cyclase domain-containing protein, partial [Desulfobulbia bacterium]